MHKELKEFGLTDNEVTIYLTLLKSGPAKPADIAQQTGLSRAYIYDSLQRLEEKQIVSSITINEKKHFQAISPKILKEIATQRLEKIQSIIPKLQKIKEETKEEARVELHKGKYIYKVLLNDIISTLKKGGEVLIFGIDDGFLLESDLYYQEHLEQYYSKLKKQGIREKVIVKTEAKIFENWRTTKYKFVEKKVIGNTAFEVYGDKVAIFIWGKPNYLLLVENKEAAKSYKEQFKILWEHAKPNK